MKNCPDCQAKPGDLHQGGCDVERCPACGNQLISCGCRGKKRFKYPRLPWTGKWPGEEACEEFGFYCYEDKSGYGNPEMHYGHIPCDKGHPDAHLDLNRLATCEWNPEKGKWVKA